MLQYEWHSASNHHRRCCKESIIHIGMPWIIFCKIVDNPVDEEVDTCEDEYQSVKCTGI